MLTFKCKSCGKQLRAPTDAQGKVATCKGCGGKLRIPFAKKLDAPSSPSVADNTKTPHQKPAAPPDGTSPKARSPAVNRAPESETNLDTPLNPELSNFGDDPFSDFPLNAAPGQAPVSPVNDDIFDTLGDVAPAAFQGAATASRFTAGAGSDTPVPGAPAYLAHRGEAIPIKQVRDAFQNVQVERNATDAKYRLSMLLVACFMFMLPVAYLMFVGGAAYSVYWYATTIIPAVFGGGPRGRAGALFMFIALVPMFIGIIMIVFLVKPILFRAGGASATRRLAPEAEPTLFALIEEIARVCNAPMPSRVEIDCTVNAAAGMRSLFSNELLLVIGAPLVNGLSARELSGVLAHEFGHFTQGAGMRTTYVIRHINLWFAKVVYQRDALDEMLDEAIADSEDAFGFVFMLSKIFIGISRAVLWCFMMAGHVVSCVLLRQMEFDADRYEIRLGGSKSFADTSRELVALELAYGATIEKLFEFYKNAKLADNLPKLVQHHRNIMPADKLAEARQEVENANTSFLETHPSMKDRIARADLEATDGCLRLEMPAANLFRNYRTICNQVSRDFYEGVLHTTVTAEELVSTDELLASNNYGLP